MKQKKKSTYFNNILIMSPYFILMQSYSKRKNNPNKNTKIIPEIRGLSSIKVVGLIIL